VLSTGPKTEVAYLLYENALNLKRGNVGRCNKRGRQVYLIPRLYTRFTTRYQFLSEVQRAHVGITVGNKPPVSVQLIRSWQFHHVVTTGLATNGQNKKKEGKVYDTRRSSAWNTTM
jgi:hypothetical protein